MWKTENQTSLHVFHTNTEQIWDIWRRGNWKNPENLQRQARLQQRACKWSCSSWRGRGRGPTSLPARRWWRWKPLSFGEARETLEGQRFIQWEETAQLWCDEKWKRWWRRWWWQWCPHSPAGHGAGWVSFRMEAAEWGGLKQVNEVVQSRAGVQKLLIQIVFQSRQFKED